MQAIVKWPLIAGTAAGTAYVMFRRRSPGRNRFGRRLARGLQRAEDLAADTRRALETSGRAISNTEHVVARLRRILT